MHPAGVFARNAGATSSNRATLRVNETRGSRAAGFGAAAISWDRGPFPRFAPYFSRTPTFARSLLYMAQSSGDSPSASGPFGSAPARSNTSRVSGPAASDVTALRRGTLV